MDLPVKEEKEPEEEEVEKERPVIKKLSKARKPSQNTDFIQCEICPKKYSSLKSYESHCTWHRRTQDKPVQTCKTCNMNFYASAQFSRHHCTGLKKVCYFCNRSDFKTKKQMLDHMSETHLVDNKFICPVEACPFVSTSLWGTYYHLSSHFNPLELICPYCSKSYTNYHNYGNHVQAHESKNNFICDRCGDQISSKKHIIRHLRTKHLNIRKYCDKCSANFSSYGALKKHKMNAHGMQSKFQCGVCLAKFAYASELKTHQRRHIENPGFRSRNKIT